MTGFADADPVGGSGDEWTNDGTAGSNFTQGTVNRRATYQTNEINSEPVVRFVNTPAGEEDRISSSLAASNFFSVSAYTLFIVFRATSTGSNHATLHRNQGLLIENNATFGVVLKNGNVALFHNTSAASVQTAFSANTPSIVECWYDGTNINIKLNGGTTVSAAAANISSLSAIVQLGVSFGASNSYDGDIAEIIGWNVDIGSTDRTTVRQGLGTQYGITV